jgi:hypothetical protein
MEKYFPTIAGLKRTLTNKTTLFKQNVKKKIQNRNKPNPKTNKKIPLIKSKKNKRWKKL